MPAAVKPKVLKPIDLSDVAGQDHQVGPRNLLLAVLLLRSGCYGVVGQLLSGSNCCWSATGTAPRPIHHAIRSALCHANRMKNGKRVP
jgi:hypothetical protein